MRTLNLLLALVFFPLLSVSSCGDGRDNPGPDPPPEVDTSYFAKGADVSWLTEMEAAGRRFYDADGVATECMTLLRGLGMNAIRLRVWVNPSDGWCNKTDLLVKARRAAELKMRIMIDFHYSDVWADPGHQTKPVAWADLSFSELCDAVGDHTTEVLTALKNWNITPEWIQVGNETGNGMLWPDGQASANMAQYAELNNAGYDAAKAIFPDSKVIVHLHGGQDNSLYRWLFNGLQSHGGRWDVIGMSLYPDKSNWLDHNNACIANVNDMISRYGCEVMICEVGMAWDEAVTARLFLSDLITRARAVSNRKCLGVFYWEPEAYSWKSYGKGAFDAGGRPTVALDAFGD